MAGLEPAFPLIGAPDRIRTCEAIALVYQTSPFEPDLDTSAYFPSSRTPNNPTSFRLTVGLREGIKPSISTLTKTGGTDWIRTSDFNHVTVALYLTELLSHISLDSPSDRSRLITIFLV